MYRRNSNCETLITPIPEEQADLSFTACPDELSKNLGFLR